MTGFELEDRQYVTFHYFIMNISQSFIRYLLRYEVSQTKGQRTSKQLADVQDKRNALHRLILNWREVQLVYTPHVASLISQTPPLPETTTSSTNAALASTLPENIPLFLPSSLPPHIRALPELKAICQLELRLREPQADDALTEIRHHRRVIQGLWQFKRLNISGTGNKPNTRMLNLYKRFNGKTERAAAKYRSARNALEVLDTGGLWSKRLKVLNKNDISGPGRDPDDTTTSNSTYEPSWIWLVPRAGVAEMDENEFNENMQVEWVKARARMMRWKEELLIVQEEMRRVLAYQQWRAAWWKERNFQHSEPAIVSGISGYAHKQAAICIQMAEKCALYWLPHLEENGIVPSWASDYDHLLEVADRQAAVSLEPDSEDAVQDVEDVDNGIDFDDNESDAEEGEEDDFFYYSD
jgi:hypothetical protein